MNRCEHAEKRRSGEAETNRCGDGADFRYREQQAYIQSIRNRIKPLRERVPPGKGDFYPLLHTHFTLQLLRGGLYCTCHGGLLEWRCGRRCGHVLGMSSTCVLCP
jgi:hypothetical protein